MAHAKNELQLISVAAVSRGIQVGDICSRLRTTSFQGKYSASTKEQVAYSFERASTVHPWKRAVLCGVSYRKKADFRLKGTINDVNLMQDLLVNYFRFQRGDIRVLTEDEPDPRLIPTRENILDSLHWLVEGSQAGDSLLFYFSGHGVRQPDSSGNKPDGFDETICPVDFMTKGMIYDNEINSIIVAPLKKGVILHAIIDACHSGTILDLDYVFDHHGKKWIEYSPSSMVSCNGAIKCKSSGLAISLSACKDDQIAADTSAFSKRMNGAMTFIFVQTVKNYPEMSYGMLLDLMCKHIEEFNQTKGICAWIRRKFFPEKKLEVPQLSSSENFNAYNIKFTL